MLAGDIQPRHLIFSVGEIAVSVQKFGTATARLNGEDLSMQRRSVVRGDIISVGSIDFELDKIKLDRSANNPRADNSTENAVEASATITSPLPIKKTKIKIPINFKKSALATGAVGMTLILAAIALNIFDNDKINTPQRNTTTIVDVKDLGKLIAEYPEVQIESHQGGIVRVSGFVESRARRQTLTDALRGFQGQIVIHVYATDEISDQARRYLGEPTISVDYAGQGRLVVSGTSADSNVHSKIDRLGKDLHGIVAVLDRVDRAGQTASISSRGELADWQKSLPAPMVGLTEDASGLRYIQLANGQRLYEGATLKTGDTIVNIEADHLVVTKSNKQDDPSDQSTLPFDPAQLPLTMEQ